MTWVEMAAWAWWAVRGRPGRPRQWYPPHEFAAESVEAFGGMDYGIVEVRVAMEVRFVGLENSCVDLESGEGTGEWAAPYNESSGTGGVTGLGAGARRWRTARDWWRTPRNWWVWSVLRRPDVEVEPAQLVRTKRGMKSQKHPEGQRYIGSRAERTSVGECRVEE